MNSRVLTVCFSVLAGVAYADEHMAYAEDGLKVDPNLYVDLETPPVPVPYVQSEGGDIPLALQWSEIEHMFRTGNYRGLTPSFVLDACRVFTLERERMLTEYPSSRDHLPRRGYVCPDPNTPMS